MGLTSCESLVRPIYVNEIKVMKRTIAVLFAVCVVAAASACTNLIVGKNASADGSVMCT